VYPDVGYPIAKSPTCIVPEIGEPVLYEKGLVVGIIVFNNKYQ
jgi:hypothetical protein